MKSGTLLTATFLASNLIIVIGALLKITHSSWGESFLIVGMLLILLIIITAIYEVLTSRYLSKDEKLLWSVCLLFFNYVSIVVYLLVGRKKIIAREPDTNMQ